jgi:hypothetical protein
MYFRKSADIVEAHRSLAAEVERVDELIYTFGDHPIRADVMSENVDIEEGLFQRILSLYVTAGVLRRESRRYCSECESLLDDQNEADECDNCETLLSRIEPDVFEVFVPVKPVTRLDLDADDDSHSLIIRIQFVGGDRGGGQKNQLQIPKEFRSIKNAIRSTDYAHVLNLSDPVFAATMHDLSKLYEARPRWLHFAGHGETRSLAFINDQELLASVVAVTARQLGKILAAYPERISVVVFNACNSAAIAKELADAGTVDIAIGWHDEVPDAVAINFAELFYHHIGNGLSISSAFVLASECVAPDDGSYRAVLSTWTDVDPQTFRIQVSQ